MSIYKASFIGIQFSKDLKEQFSKLLTELKELVPNLDTTNAKVPHITLAFLSEQSEENLIAIKEKIKANIKAGEVSIKGFGFFTNYNLVLYLNVNLSSELLDLQKDLSEQLKDYIKETDQKPFVPHLTLGRIRDQRAIDEFFDLDKKEKVRQFLKNVQFDFTIENIAIYGVDVDNTTAGQQVLHEIKIK